MFRSKRGSWFFEGYQSEPRPGRNGRVRNTLVYRGEWYGLGLEAKACRRYKSLCFALTALMTVFFLLVSFFPAGGGMTPWVGGVALFGLVPLMFLWIGMFGFLTAGLEWELRVFYGGYRRLQRWNLVFLVLMAVALVNETAYLFRTAQTMEEVSYLMGLLACAGLSAALCALQRRYPAHVVQGPDIR